jgi:Ca2+-binding EF-hand superfamily protein
MLSFAKSLLGSTVAASALFAAATALAQTTAPAAPTVSSPAAAASSPHAKGQRHPHGFKSLDVNKDGQISREEAKAHPMLNQNFDAIDTDKNGQLSKDELKAAKAARKGKAHDHQERDGKGREGMLQKLDTNKDGQISRDEAKGRPYLEKNFDAIDANKDGQLSADELKAFHAARWGKGPAAK